jgi:hypothetical protein
MRRNEPAARACLVLFAGWAAAVGLAAPATADVTLVEWKSRSVFTGFESDRCDGPASVSVELPIRARYIEPATMPVGREVPAFDGFEATRGFARVTSTKVDRRGSVGRLTWTAIPTAPLCGRAREVGTDLGWFTGWWTFRAAFAQARRVRTTRNDFRRLTRVALIRRYPYYTNSQVTRIRCAKPRRNQTRCNVFFYGGDTFFEGYVLSRLKRTADREGLLWSYRLRVVQTDEYCQRVTKNYPCTEVHRLRRSGLPTPAFVSRR